MKRKNNLPLPSSASSLRCATASTASLVARDVCSLEKYQSLDCKLDMTATGIAYVIEMLCVNVIIVSEDDMKERRREEDNGVAIIFFNNNYQRKGV